MGNDLGPGFENFDAMFNAVSGLVMIGFVVVIGLFVFNAVKSASQGIKNSASPEVTARARIVDKRIRLSGGGTTHSAPTLSGDGTFLNSGISSSDPVHEQHFVTFEQSSGERFEMKVPASEYGLLVVGDQGTVTMKGTRYLGFQRELMR
ncbi:MAG: DUF2500 domain-containing protein [Propionibacteriaceae bacterium]|nr:DUF2500 domain-containing protein [Propionibacteriaceae bacterium]